MDARKSEDSNTQDKKIPVTEEIDENTEEGNTNSSAGHEGESSVAVTPPGGASIDEQVDGEEQGSDAAEEEDEDALPEGMSPEEALAAGRIALTANEIELALSFFTRAIHKIRETEPDDFAEILGPYYLAYGSALLNSIEHSSELFAFAAAPKPDQPSHSSTAPPPPDSPEVERDDELAWEVLETARLTYTKWIQRLKEENTEVPSAVAEDSVQVYLRLGDMCLIEEKYVEARKEYSEAWKLCEELAVARLQWPGVLVPLAQSALFSCEPDDALALFKKAKAETERCLEDGEVPERRREDFERTVEDLGHQIEEVEKYIREGVYAAASAATRKEGEAPSLKLVAPVENKDQFDQSKLNAAPEDIVDLGVVGRKAKRYSPEEEEKNEKKRKIDEDE